MAKMDCRDEHKIIITFNNSHAKNNYEKKIRAILQHGEALDK